MIKVISNSMTQKLILPTTIIIAKVRDPISSPSLSLLSNEFRDPDPLLVPLLLCDVGVGLAVVKFVLRYIIHPCIRWTTGGSLICISAVAKSINC